MFKKAHYIIGLAALLLASTTFAAEITVPMNFTAKTGVGPSAGTIVISETQYGLLFTPHLTGLAPNLTPGIHGFHVHQNPACDDNGMAAGGHLDPQNTGKHLGPYNNQGHLGDLPALYINQDGTATLPVLAPRLHKLSQITGHSLMVHNGGDNYSDTPEKLGGGGIRMVCGVIK
jgi:Cu-Zn family superoxide dismutase